MTIGVGVMDYHGWAKGDGRGDAISENYTSKLASYVSWLLEQRFNVRLLTGDLRDAQAVTKVLAKVSASGAEMLPERIASRQSSSLHDLMTEIAQTDFVVVSRYHNVVCALKLDKPVISLGYNKKNDYLLAQFRQESYCQHIETFDVEELKRKTREIADSVDTVRTQIAKTNLSLQQKLTEQEEMLLEKVIGK
jgi:polysaccharide pyruvyl transferase WcaK-like protein